MLKNLEALQQPISLFLTTSVAAFILLGSHFFSSHLQYYTTQKK